MVAGTVGVSALTCAGAGVLATRQPRFEKARLICGDGEPLDRRALVAYATRAGSTREIAQVIGEVLCEAGMLGSTPTANSNLA
jgi:menaquinone-dependent protoporphyrinogen oxidase